MTPPPTRHLLALVAALLLCSPACSGSDEAITIQGNGSQPPGTDLGADAPGDAVKIGPGMLRAIEAWVSVIPRIFPFVGSFRDPGSTKVVSHSKDTKQDHGKPCDAR